MAESSGYKHESAEINAGKDTSGTHEASEIGGRCSWAPKATLKELVCKPNKVNLTSNKLNGARHIHFEEQINLVADGLHQAQHDEEPRTRANGKNASGPSQTHIIKKGPISIPFTSHSKSQQSTIVTMDGVTIVVSSLDLLKTFVRFQEHNIERSQTML